ncbi:3-oxoacyl-ACP synthase [Enterococcus faecalis]|uniref:thiolase family protein n=1 Tax=Enterococcus faecalis TaxID=1351 RepID=UPI003DA0C719
MKNYARISCTSRYVPENCVTNHQLSEMFGASDEWIHSRTGIFRRITFPQENTSDLCHQVAKQLLEKSGKQASEIDFILVPTIAPDFNMLFINGQLQGVIGAFKVYTQDISAACSGFVYALSMAEKLVFGGRYQTGLVIGGETFSKMLDWTDRSTAGIANSATTGVLIEAAETVYYIYDKFHIAGRPGIAMAAGYTINESPFYQGHEQASKTLQMEGHSDFICAIKDVSQIILSLVTDETVVTFLQNQANVRIIDKIARKTKISREKLLKKVGQ